MKLQKDRHLFRKTCTLMGVDHPNAVRIDKLTSGHRYTGLDEVGDERGRTLSVTKGHTGCTCRLGEPTQSERHLGDDPQSPF